MLYLRFASEDSLLSDADADADADEDNVEDCSGERRRFGVTRTGSTLFEPIKWGKLSLALQPRSLKAARS